MIGRNFGNPIAACAGPQASCEERAKHQEVSMATVWWSSERHGSKTIERKNLQCNLLVWCGCRPKTSGGVYTAEKQSRTHLNQKEKVQAGTKEQSHTAWSGAFLLRFAPPAAPVGVSGAGGAVLNGLNVAEIAQLSGDPSGVGQHAVRHLRLASTDLSLLHHCKARVLSARQKPCQLGVPRSLPARKTPSLGSEG